jgi:hypothetical protein
VCPALLVHTAAAGVHQAVQLAPRVHTAALEPLVVFPALLVRTAALEHQVVQLALKVHTKAVQGPQAARPVPRAQAAAAREPQAPQPARIALRVNTAALELQAVQLALKVRTISTRGLPAARPALRVNTAVAREPLAPQPAHLA